MMPAMNATFTNESFPSLRAAVRIPPGGRPALLQGHALETALRGSQDGLLLTAWQVSDGGNLHSHLWEVHVDGDEVLAMLSGAVTVDCVDGSHRTSTCLAAGQGLLIPKGVWHRLDLREPGLLLALSPTAGTQLSEQPGGPP